MTPKGRCTESARAPQALEARLSVSLTNFREDLNAFSTDGANENRYRDAIECLRQVTERIDAVLHSPRANLPDTQLSHVELRYKNAVMHSSEELLVQSQRILREMRELAGRD
jgi:hypothetical protein